MAPVEHSDLEFLILADTDTYIDLDIKLYVRVKLISGKGRTWKTKTLRLSRKGSSFSVQSVYHNTKSHACDTVWRSLPVLFVFRDNLYL